MCGLLGQTLAVGMMLACGTEGAWRTEAAGDKIIFSFVRNSSYAGPIGSKIFSLTCDSRSGKSSFLTHVKFDAKARKPQTIDVSVNAWKAKLRRSETNDGAKADILAFEADDVQAEDLLNALEGRGMATVKVGRKTENIAPTDAGPREAADAFRDACRRARV